MEMSLGNKLDKLMKEKKLTGKQLANDTGITEGTVSKILTGVNTNPKSDTIVTLAKYFNVSSDYLLGLSDYKTPQKANIGKETGLSEMAINNLKDLQTFHNTDDTKDTDIMQYYVNEIMEVQNRRAINYLFTDSDFLDILSSTMNLVNQLYKSSILQEEAKSKTQVGFDVVVANIDDIRYYIDFSQQIEKTKEKTIAFLNKFKYRTDNDIDDRLNMLINLQRDNMTDEEIQQHKEKFEEWLSSGWLEGVINNGDD